MALEKITTQQMDTKGVCAAPDVLSGTPAQNKAVFDRMVRELIAPAYNEAVEAITAMEQTESGIEAAEALRVAAENLRVEAETARAQAESGRAEAEQQRQEAETQRQDLETGYVARSENGAKASESWAVGGTGTREGEDTNNAKYWSEQAAAAAGGGVMSFNGRNGAVVPQAGDYNAEQVGAIPSSEKGAASGVATLGADGKVPSGQLPSLDYVPTSEKGKENGVATLGADGKVPAGQLPEISSVKTYTATIGTTWTENEDTGVKSQSVPITGVLAKHTAKVDHAYTGDGTSDGYAVFVEAENQYLTYITNGYAETYDGGITFYIFGDAPTVSIPIVVEVA